MGTIINSSLQTHSQPNRAICFPGQIWSKGGGQSNPVFEVLISKLEGLWVGFGVSSKGCCRTGTRCGGAAAPWGGGHGTGTSPTANFPKVVVIKNPSSQSPAMASNLTPPLCVRGTFHPSHSKGNDESQEPKKARTERHFLFPRVFWEMALPSSLAMPGAARSHREGSVALNQG